VKNLFDAMARLERISIPDANVSYLECVELGEPPEILLSRLIDETPWRQEAVRVWGKTFNQPRLVAWYGDAGKAYHYSGISLAPLTWTGTLLGVKSQVEDVVEARFNSVLLNYYRDENDSMGYHSDDEKELGPRPVIASISLGAERTLTFIRKANMGDRPFKVRLASGSLLLMRDETQENYKHGIAKEKSRIGPRVNLTFRQIDL